MDTVKLLDQYYLAKRANDTAECLAIADILVEKVIPELLVQPQNMNEVLTEEETLG